jgi:tetratricopeptide (TPR) repeat protein
VVVGAVAGTIFGGRYLKAKHAEEAAALVADASTKVESGDLEALKSVEASLGRALELDSRSLDAARTWLHDRVLRSYLWPSDDRRDGGLASAMERGKAVGLDEDEMAYARVALALTSEDTASAVRMAKALDASSKGKAPDAWRELVIGWVLERAGDGRAFDRYAKALEIDPSLSPARLSLAKGAAQAGNVAKTTDLTAKLPAGWAVLKDDLVGLASLTAGAKRDTKVDEATARPASFGWMAASLRASDPTLAQEARRTLLDKAIVAARDPLDLTRVGRVALSLGELDEAAAAALRALEASAIFTPARALAARIALERGRVDDAVGALAGLDPKGDPEVAALSAWLAYERGDSASIGPLLDDPSIAPSAFDAPDLKGIVLPLRALTAGKIDPNDAASLDAVTKLGGLGPIVAFDAALDAGNVPVADSIGKTWRDVEGSPARASRLAKLARLTGKGAEADRLSKIATEQGVVVPRALVERALTLCGLGRADEATKLLTRYPLVAVDEQPWLRAYALALAGKVDDAKRSVAKLALPESTAPWPVRRDALLALTAVGDRTRSGPLLDLLRKERPADPDVTSAERLR